MVIDWLLTDDFFGVHGEATTSTTAILGSGSEQADVTLPSGVSFNVTRISTSTVASGVSVSIDDISLGSATKQLKISVQAEAASFTSPVVGATTWSAADVTWNAASWTNAAGSAGTLSSASYATVATCNAGASSCSTTGLIFTLAAKNTVKRSGNHSLTLRWKLESIGT